MLRNVVAVMVLCAGVLHGANRIRVEGVTAQPGQQNVRVRILIDNDDPLYAVSWAASYPAGLTYRDLTLEGTVFGSTGVNAEYFQVIEGAGYVGAALLVDYDLPYEERSLPAGTNQFGFALYFNVTPASGCGSEYTIDLRNDLGSPPIEAVFTTVPPGALSRSVLPALVDGAITVSVPPTLSSVVPDTVPVGDAVQLTITGTHLTPATDVAVGGKMLLNPVFVNSTTIRGTAPSQVVGSYAVFVSNACGLDSIPDAVQYVQDQPVIFGVNPKWVRPAGDMEIAISGSNFSPDSTVTVGGAPLGQTQVVSETLIRGTVPARSTGPADVTVTNAGGSHTLADGVVYVGQPTITQVIPGSGDGGVDVVIEGTWFTDAVDTTVLFGVDQVQNIEILSSTVLTGRLPACLPGVCEVQMSVYTTGGVGFLNPGYTCRGCIPTITFRRGDANCNGGVDIADAIAILGYLFGGADAICLDALDVNDDGKIDIADAVRLLAYLFAGGSPPPPPFPELGIDPTPDELDCAQQCG